MTAIRIIVCALCTPWFACGRSAAPEGIDREALVRRNNPVVGSVDSLSALTVGNGEFAFTVDATGLQTFPEAYTTGIPLGTQSQWGWHSFPNPDGFRFEETLREFDFGRGHTESYPVTGGRGDRRHIDAANWFRANAHRLHLGIVGLELPDETEPSDIGDIDQLLDMWSGSIGSDFTVAGKRYRVETVCHPTLDAIAAKVRAHGTTAAVKFRFPYPTGGHTDDGCNWLADDKHSTTVIERTDRSATLKRTIDRTTYYATLSWEGSATLVEKERNYFVLSSASGSLVFSCAFGREPFNPGRLPSFSTTRQAAARHWAAYWNNGGAVDFSECRDPRASELERRVVLSQYLLAVQCAGSTPPQETGLTYNSWHGKFHLEMIWWHQAQFALWGRPEMLARTLGWYRTASPAAREVARRQGFEGVRWMKMIDTSGIESPSSVGPFLVWQQPHIIHMAELLYRIDPSAAILDTYADLVQASAEFMYSFAVYDETADRYVLRGLIPAQETLRPETTVNPPFELSYWHWGLATAQLWRERTGKVRVAEWDRLIEKLSPLAAKNGLYLAAESAPDTYQNRAYTSDHPAVLGALGILPDNRLSDRETMRNTLEWIWENWNWDRTWGWDYPMVAMNAARLGDPEKAVRALLMDRRTNTYLINGHNYQNNTLRVYLPGNGGLLTAVAMMCAGWDGSKGNNPGFPNDGNWNVRWEGLSRLP